MTIESSIKKMTSPLKIVCCCALITMAFLFQAASAPGAEPLTKIQVPDSLSPGLAHLLDLADPENQLSFQPDKIKKLLAFVKEPKDPGALYFADPKLGSPSAYFDIYNGIKRFAKSFKQIMEYPSLPSINTFGDAFSKINAMSANELKERLKIYLNILENRYGRDYRPPRAWSPQVFKDKSPWFQMSTEAMRSVLMVEYMKHAMGKSDTNVVVALLGLSK